MTAAWGLLSSQTGICIRPDLVNFSEKSTGISFPRYAREGFFQRKWGNQNLTERFLSSTMKQ